jgi:hypothetical protein
MRCQVMETDTLPDQSPGEWWKGDREDPASSISFVNQLALMLPNDPVGHE